jgi:hypothetical protein
VELVALEFLDESLYVALDDAVAVDQFLDVVDQDDLFDRQAALVVEVVKDRAPADKGLDVALKAGGEVGLELRKELALAAGPLDKGRWTFQGRSGLSLALLIDVLRRAWGPRPYKVHLGIILALAGHRKMARSAGRPPPVGR